MTGAQPLGPRSFADAGEWLGLEGRSVLVTGAASGIGLASVNTLLALGAKVIALDRDEPPAGAHHERISWHRLDVRSREELEAVRELLQQGGRRLDAVVANAGITVRKPLLELSEEEEERIIGVNLIGTLRTLRVFVPLLAAGDGRVVVTSSATAVHAMRDRAVYAATKAGLSGLVRAAALEWGPSGIAVNAVGPGIIRTGLTDAYANAHPERERAARENTPLRRLGTPEEVADAIVYLCSPASAFISGQTLMIDGGLTVGSTWW